VTEAAVPVQDALWDEPPPPVVNIEYRGLTLQEQFEAFHNANPWVMQALVRLSLQALADGRRRLGIKMLVEVLRWQYGRATTGSDFRLNNNYSSRYVRAIIGAHPELADLFATRELRTP
jgi:hypothetical protein